MVTYSNQIFFLSSKPSRRSAFDKAMSQPPSIQLYDQFPFKNQKSKFEIHFTPQTESPQNTSADEN